jgi:hypothetical protein
MAVADYLYVLAKTVASFAAWCRDHGFSPNDPRLLRLIPPDCNRLLGTSGIRYVYADADPECRNAFDVMLEVRGAVELTGEEAVAWLDDGGTRV